MRVLSGHRSNAKWLVDLLDEDDQVIRRLPRTVSGSFEIAPFERLGGGATLVLHEEVDWLKHRVRFTYDPGVEGVEPWPVGTYLFESPKRVEDAYGFVSYETSLLTKLVIPDEDCLDDYLTVKKGANLVAAAVKLLKTTGQTVMSVTDSDYTARTATTFEPGTSKLTVINELLTAAGYFSLQVDGMGVYLFEPYVLPEDRAPVWAFAGDEYDVMLPAYTFEQNLVDIPNQTIVVAQGDDKTPGLVGVARNESASSPYSYLGRGGRWVTRKYEQDAASQEVINQIAQRRLDAAMSPIAHWEVTHAIIPIRGHDVVLLADQGELRTVSLQRLSVGGFDVGQLASAIYRIGLDEEDDKSNNSID